MTVYFVLYALIISFSIFIRRGEPIGNITEKTKKSETFAMLILVCFVIALRHPSMGLDLGYGRGNGYLDWFQVIGSHSWERIIHSGGYQNYEWGYIVFNKLISYISTEYQCLLIMSAVASLMPLAFMISKYSNDRLFSVIVYLGLPSFLIIFSGLRQGIAIGITCFSYIYIEQKKPFKFILTIILASLFHYSAVIFLIAYPVFRIKLDKQKRILSLFAILIVYIFRIPLFSILSKIFKDNASLEINDSKTLLLVFVAIYIFCTVFINENDKIASGFLNIFYLAIICMCFSGVYLTAMRVGYYFMIGLVIALPNIICNISDANLHLICKLSISGIFIIYGLYSLYSSSWGMAYPYDFFWSNIL